MSMSTSTQKCIPVRVCTQRILLVRWISIKSEGKPAAPPEIQVGASKNGGESYSRAHFPLHRIPLYRSRMRQKVEERLNWGNPPPLLGGAAGWISRNMVWLMSLTAKWKRCKGKALPSNYLSQSAKCKSHIVQMAKSNQDPTSVSKLSNVFTTLQEKQLDNDLYCPVEDAVWLQS